MHGYIYCISYTMTQGTPRYYIGMSKELPFYILIKRNYDLPTSCSPCSPRSPHQRYKCVFAKFVKDLAIEKAKMDRLLHNRCIAIMDDLRPEHKKGNFVEMENTEEYNWHRPTDDNDFIPSIISLEYIRSIFDLSPGDYIDDVDVEDTKDISMLNEYNDYVICERIEHAFYKLEKEKELLQYFKGLKVSFDKINVDLVKTLQTYEALSDSTKNNVMRMIQSL